jgi:hypothetical protein
MKESSITPRLFNLDTRWVSAQASTACYGNNFTLCGPSALPVRYELDCKYCYK